MNENLKNYKILSKPSNWAVKTIKAGRLKGKSDINPQWRYEALTQVYGTCGIGWKYTIDKLWTENGTDGQIFAFANISLYIKENGEWSDPIPANGGNMLVVNEHKGPYNNDEAFKMAITDALGNAAKMIGVAAEIYRGTFNTKYELQESLDLEPKKTMSPENKKQAQQAQDEDAKKAELRKKIAPIAKDASKEKLDKIEKIKNGKNSKDLNLKELYEIYELLKKGV